VPVAVSGGRVFTAIAVGGRHACGLTGQGAAYCWGANVSGQLGNGTTTQSAVPVAVSGNHVFTRLVAGDAQTCGLTASGEALCWGSRAAYLMLFGTVPAPLGGGLAFADIAVGQDFGCGITTAGATYCWGRGDQGQLGTGLPHTTGDPVPVAGGSSFRSLSARNGTTCGVTTTNTVACWGRRGHGVLGDGHLGWEARPVPVSGGLTFASLDAGDGRTCGITHGGETWCWGHVAGTDFNSQLHEAVPAPVAGPSFASVSVGEGQGPLGSYACGLTAEGAAHCWGANVSGALGTGGTSSSLTPVPVVGGRSFLALGAGREACALTTDGALWCWGGYDGFDPSKLAPTAVPGGSGPFTALAAGAGHVCALLDGGGARCRGFNYSGELGDGTTTTREQPVPVTGGRAYTRISAYADGTCAIEVGGAAWCWGWGVPTPAPVPGGLRFTEISVGGFNSFDPAFACGIADGGGAWCWGENLHGMLGNGLETSSAAPVAVDGPTFVHVTAGVQHACGLTAAGEAWCWGRTDDGQLGHGRTQYSALPVPVSR
jgi:alpha-tubulin suppressor-like RCC1 family protein